MTAVEPVGEAGGTMAGSEKRQRGEQIKIRFTADEYADVSSRADKAGLTRAAFMRAAALGTAGPRAQRRLPADAATLRQILGHLGRVGNNLNQIARHMNRGREDDMGDALAEALGDYARVRDMIYVALGKDADPSPAIGPSPLPAFPDPAAPSAADASIAAAFNAAAQRAKDTAPPPVEPPGETPTEPMAATEAPPVKPGSRFIRPPRP